MEINSYLLRERTPAITLGATGPVGTAAATVDVVSNLGVTASAAGLTFTLPNPTDTTRSGRSVLVMNTGVNQFVMYNNSIKAGQYVELIWGAEDSTWHAPSVPQESAADFWRSGSLAGITPDGATDTQDAIFRSGQTVIDTGTVADSGLTLDDLRATHASISYMNSMVENQNTAVGVNDSGKVVLANGVGVPDVRATNLNPQDYAAGVSQAFKQTSAIGMTGIAGLQTYANLTTTRRYATTTDFSGGPVRQDVDLDDGRQYFRVSTGATTWGPWLLESRPASEFHLQDLMELGGTAKVSLDYMVSWTNRIITMTAGVRTQEPAGYHDINMPAVGAAIPVSDGSTRVVVAATAGQTGLSGGIPLNVWESLWYFVPTASGAAGVVANFRIQAYNTPITAANGLFGAGIDAQQDAGQWVRIVSRSGDNSSSQFMWGFGESCSAGAQFGNAGMAEQEALARHADKTRYLANGYAFRPWNLTNSAQSFGFSGAYLRSISAASGLADGNSGGYRDITPPAAGTTIYGVGGVANTAWRATNANDAMYRMGEAYTGEGPSAATAVCDLATYNTLWFAHDINGATNTGTWYRTQYSNAHVVPPHWVFVAQLGDDNLITIFTGEKLNRGEFLWNGKRDRLQTTSRFEVTSMGRFDCRWTQANFFAGTAANGLGTANSTAGVLVSWPDNAGLMAAMDSDQGRPYTWVNVPSAGYAIPVLDTAGTRTRIIQTIGGRRFVPLAQWETLVYIPQQLSLSGATVDRGWFVTNYGDSRHIPMNAITIASWSTDGGQAGANNNKTRVKMGDGTYIQPGLTLASATPVLFDQAHGTTMDDWRDIVVAGQTGPGMTAVMPAIAGVTGPYGGPYNPQFRLLSNQLSPRGSIELRGLLQLNTNVTVVNPTIAFLPGCAVLGNPIVMVQVTSTGLADTQPIPVQLRLQNAIINGSSGVSIVSFSNSLNTTTNPFFTLAVNGGARAAGNLAWLSFDNIVVPHG